ncbi:hypothetical protein AB0A70_06475 [Streptomyces morookaense]|uniref:hypothetical protein n=1 Tax=Streptomyces morookaense TaxID=1970 RepID=UPI00340F79DF
MKHWKFEFAIQTREGIHTFDDNCFAADEADPEDLARKAMAEILRKYPELASGRLIRCRYIQGR